MTEFLSTNPELALIAQKLSGAINPEDIFGSLEGVDDRVKEGRSIYRQLSKATYPDLFLALGQKAVAEAAFKKLNELWEAAQLKLQNGTYGIIDISKSPDAITITSGRRQYTVSTQAHQRGFSNTYLCDFSENGVDTQAIFKVARDPADNDLVENEARILKILETGNDFDKFHHYFPSLIESFSYLDTNDPVERRVNILTLSDPRLFTFKQIREAFTGGIDPKDVAWIWRRLLVALGFTHQLEIIHGAILPDNVLIQDHKHGVILSEWAAAAYEPKASREKISVVDTNYLNWYPRAVLSGHLPTPALDIYMGAENMVYLLGGEPTDQTFPRSTPAKLEQFFRGVLATSQKRAPADAWAMMEDFDLVIEDLWGPRKFHPFSIPSGANDTFW